MAKARNKKVTSRKTPVSKSAGGSRRKAEPVSMTSADLVEDRVSEVRRLFPEAAGEKGVDFDRLKLTLGESIDGSAERYSFSWAGKRDAIQLLQLPSRACLIPDSKASVDFEPARNLLIEGDNLEVLKLLYKPYFGRIKLIYIDPPYNTGNDLVYADDYADPLDAYLRLTGQKDSNGNVLTSNPETSGRYHSAWLSMMFPRLFLARQLLRDDGVIFVSIDDHELHNLRMLMNEIFGEENFLGCVVRATGTTTGQDSRGFGSSFDYLLSYSKSSGYEIGGLPLSEKDMARFNLEDENGKYSLLQLRKTGSNDRREDRPFMYYPVKAPDDTEIYPIGPGGYESCWRCGPTTYQRLVTEGYIVWKKVKKDGVEQWTPYVKYYLEGRQKRPSPLWNDIDGNKKATLEVKELLGERIFSNPKPTALIKRILEISTEPDTEDLVLDFFAGSGTTAHAVLDLNAKNGGNRRFICVQLPEPTPEDSPARRAGYSTIADIGAERVRRVIKNLRREAKGKLKLDGSTKTEDLGFRLLAQAASNFKPWTGVEDKDGEEYAKQMEFFAEGLVEGWKLMNVIWEVTVKEGYSLTSRIAKVPAAKGNTIYRVTDESRGQSFLICLDDRVKTSALAGLDLSRDGLFVCRDSALDDTAAANLALQCRLRTI